MMAGLVFIAEWVWAAQVDPFALLDKAGTLRAVRFEFTQTTTVKATGEKQTLRGWAAFEKPDRFRVEQKTPALVLVCDGEKTWIHNLAARQVMVEPAGDIPSALPSGLSPFRMTADALRQHFTGRAEGNVLILSPKDPGGWPYTLRLTVDRNTGLVARAEMNSDTQTTLTRITGLKADPVFATGFFAFTAPSGAQIFDSTASPRTQP
jgi:outer membrane lipoprotein-sorting protein